MIPLKIDCILCAFKRFIHPLTGSSSTSFTSPSHTPPPPPLPSLLRQVLLFDFTDVFLCLWHLLHIVIKIAHTPRCTQMQSTLRIRLSTHIYTRTHTHAHTHAHSHTHVEEAATLKQLVKSKNALHTKLFRCNEAVNARQQLSPHPSPPRTFPFLSRNKKPKKAE